MLQMSKPCRPSVPVTSKTQLLLLLDNLKLTLPMPGKRVFPIFPDPDQFIDILLVNLVDVRRIWGFGLHDANGSSDHNVNGSSVRHHADIVVEHAASVEERDLTSISINMTEKGRK